MRIQRTSILSLALILVSAVLFPAAATLNVHFIDVGQGDAILIDCGDWEALIDAGPGTRKGNAELLEVLGECVGDGDLELTVLSHPHADHYGGFVTVFDQYRVLHLWRSGDLDPDTCGSKYMAFTNAVAREGSRIELVAAGERLSQGSLVITVLSPQGELQDSRKGDDNDNSLVLLLTFGTIRFLLTGDIQAEGATALAPLDLGDDPLVLKVPHHGASNGAGITGISGVDPDVSVISTGNGNRHGHPDESFVEALAEFGPVFITTCGCSEDCFTAVNSRSQAPVYAEAGTIHMWTDGASLWAEIGNLPAIVLIDGNG